MKNISLIIILLVSAYVGLSAQKTYTENGGELIFSFSDVEYRNVNIDTKMRFTMFFHLGRQRHYDFSDILGIYSGFGLRNIGFTTDYGSYVEKRRTYSLGIPAALKIGSFNNHMYFYGGGEYEMFFHYKQKQKSTGAKLKYNEWFSKRTERIMPSLFCGVQFPGGINLKAKYYLKDFLNRDFRGNDFGQLIDYSDFNSTKVFYIALTFNFKSKDLKKLYNPGESREVRFADKMKF